MPLITAVIQVPDKAKAEGREIRGTNIKRTSVKLQLFADGMVVYIGKSSDPSYKLLKYLWVRTTCMDSITLFCTNQYSHLSNIGNNQFKDIIEIKCHS